MNLRDLVEALVRRDPLAARQWMADATRAKWDWSSVEAPREPDPLALSVAAAVVEMMAERLQVRAPAWTAAVPPVPQRLFLVRAAEFLPRLRRMCEEEGPEPMRRRGILAPPDFLTAA